MHVRNGQSGTMGPSYSRLPDDGVCAVKPEELLYIKHNHREELRRNKNAAFVLEH